MNDIVVNLPKFADLNFMTIVPMLIAIAGALVILCIDLINKNLDKSLYVILSILFLVIDFSAIISFNSDIRGFFDLMFIDGLSILSQSIIVLGSILFLLGTLNKLRFQEFRYPEYFALFLFMTAGFQFMVSSDSLILIFVGLETGSLALYILIAMHNRKNSLEAAIKYFTMGALATAFFAFSVMIFYALTNSVELEQISQTFVSNDFAYEPIILLGVIFMLAALGFKLSLVPYHTWVPDVYEGTTSNFAAYLSAIPKIAGFVVALRFFEIFIASENKYVEIVLYIIIVLSMTIPNIIALLQTDIKRMLAYSSISNAGFVMSAIYIGTSQSTNALFLYWILFLITNFGAFTILWLNKQKDFKLFNSDHSMEKYSGLVKKSPFYAFLLALFLLSLAGVPPFGLFWGKMYLIGSAVNSEHFILAFIMILNSAIAAFYYLKPIVFMFLKEPIEKHVKSKSNATGFLNILVAFYAAINIISIIYIEPLLNYISFFVQISGY